MERKEDIEFLEDFRKKVDSFIYLGYIPAEPLPYVNNPKYYEYKEEMLKSEFQNLRKDINQMIPKVEQLLIEFGIGFTVIYYPAPVTGRPPIRLNLFDIMLNNNTEKSFDKSEYLDRIDQAIGSLKSIRISNESNINSTVQAEIQKGFVFIAMPMDPNIPALVDVHETIKRVALSLGLVAERIDDPESNERITDRIIEALKKAEYIVVDLTYSRQNVFFEAGYAQGLGKIPIYIASHGTKIEFDLKDYPILFFKNLKELDEKLTKRLKGLGLKNI